MNTESKEDQILKELKKLNSRMDKLDEMNVIAEDMHQHVWILKFLGNIIVKMKSDSLLDFGHFKAIRNLENIKSETT